MNEPAMIIPEQAVEAAAAWARQHSHEHTIPSWEGDDINWHEIAKGMVEAAQPLMGVERAWISVKDRLPDLDQVVLVHYPRLDGTPTYNWGARVDGGESWCWGVKGGYGSSIHLGKDADYNDIEVDDDYPVTHWKPLDPPPSFPSEKQTEQS
jgi:hypothetical protein